MSAVLQHSRCDDGVVMIHDEGDVFAFIDSNKASPFDEELAVRFCVSFNAYADLVAGLRAAEIALREEGFEDDADNAALILAKHGGGQ
jgi:hypothetical protein